MSSMWKRLKEWTGLSKHPSNQELNRSRYSSVNTDDLTADTLKLWLQLPEEVKNDPGLAPLKQLYEREKGPPDPPLKPNVRKLPPVKSAPILSGLQALPEEIEFIDDKNDVQEFLEKNREPREQNGEGGDVTVTSTTHTPQTKQSKISKAKYYTKMSLLIASWCFFTSVFLLYDDKKEVFVNTAVLPNQDTDYILPYQGPSSSFEVSFKGPFLSLNQEMKLNHSELLTFDVLKVWVERVGSGNDEVLYKEKSPPWTIYLQKDVDFNPGELHTRIFNLNSSTSFNNATVSVIMNTTSNKLVPLAISFSSDPLDPNVGVICSLVLLAALYVLIIFEVINRTMAAIIIATLSLSVLAIFGQRPSIPQIISWLDTETLLLLFSMMILVAIMAETGIFDFLAVFTFEVTKGRLWPLIFLLCGITAVLSTFLDNVTTVLLMSPVTIRLCEVMDLDPVPILMFMAIYSNVGGSATPVGDPPCVIIASNKAVVQGGINFTNFTAHMSLGIILVFIQTTVQFRLMFRDSNKLRLNVPRDIQDLRQQISIWRRAVESLPHLSKDVLAVRERLERKITKLTFQLEKMEKESSKRACPKDTYRSTLLELKIKYKIRDKMLLIKAAVAICFVVILFFLHSIPELKRVSLAWTALLGAILLLILADREDLEPILHRVEWSTLLFFAALFILMEALSELGLILYVGGLMEQLIMLVDENSRLAAAIVVIIWVSGAISAFVDNIPLSTMMVRVVVNIAANPVLNLPLGPLVWALLFGSCLGGNGTLIAASANVVCAGVAEQHGYKFTFSHFFRVGFPIMIGHLVVATGYLLVCHCVFTWH